ncbi:MAG: hypothetical protein ACK5UI_01820 [Bacteroidota bacterium]|jgi:hypothetical protein
MKTTKLRKVFMALGAVVLTNGAFAQLQDEKNVTITMDLQPILQLKMEGPDQLDFTFDEINEYYAGIVKYGATILKVSATVSFDLWAAGLSQGQEGNFLWDNPVEYASATGATDDIPLTALELRQFPGNPSIGTCLTTVAASSDYSTVFQPITTAATSTMTPGNNNIYCPNPTTPYTSPTSTNAAGTSEKYIAGGTGTGAGCSIAGGSYILNSNANTSDYRYVIDYRILPNLPVTFPAHMRVAPNPVNATNATAPYMIAADGATTLTGDGATYAQPGVYTMYVKYILAQDQ